MLLKKAMATDIKTNLFLSMVIPPVI